MVCSPLRGGTRYADLKYELAADRLDTTTLGLYGPNTELGRWLRTKPAMVRIGSLLFTHGGVSPTLTGRDLTLAQVNDGLRSGLDYPLHPHESDS